MRWDLRSYLLIFVLASLPAPALTAGKESFKTVVKDKNGKPVPGVTLSVLSGGKKFGAGVSDANGEVNVPLNLASVPAGQSMEMVVRKCHHEGGTTTTETILAPAGAQVPDGENCDDRVAGVFPWPGHGGSVVSTNVDDLTLTVQQGAASIPAQAPTTSGQATTSNFSAESSGSGVCTVSTTITPTLRREGLTELTGDILLRCTAAPAEPSPNASGTPESTPTLNLKLNVVASVSSGQSGKDAIFVIEQAPAANTTLPDGHSSKTDSVLSGSTVTYTGIPRSTSDIKITDIRITATTPSSDPPLSGIDLNFSSVTVDYPVQFIPPVISIHLEALDKSGGVPAAGAFTTETLNKMANSLQPGDSSIFFGGTSSTQQQPSGGYTVTRRSEDGNIKEITNYGPGNQIISKSTTIVPPFEPGGPTRSTTTTVLASGGKYVEEGGGEYFVVTAYDSSGTAFATQEITVHSSFVEVSTSSNSKPQRETSSTPWDGKSTLDLGNIIDKIKSDFIANTQAEMNAASGVSPTAAANPASATAPASKPLFWWQAGGGLGANFFSSVNSCGPLLSVVPDAACHAADRAFGFDIEGQIGVTPYFAGSFSYNNFQSIDRNATAPALDEHSSFHSQFETITGRLILPIGPISVFGEGGVAFAQNHLKEVQSASTGSSSGSLTTSFHVNTTSPTVGGGAQFNLSKHFSIGARVQYFHAEKGPVLNEHNLTTVGTVTFHDFFR